MTAPSSGIRDRDVVGVLLADGRWYGVKRGSFVVVDFQYDPGPRAMGFLFTVEDTDLNVDGLGITGPMSAILAVTYERSP